jgi:hypothetical protein
MNLRTPLIASLAVVSALGGVAAAAIALPTSAPEPAAALVAPTATPTPEVQTKTIRRTIHVVRRDKAQDSPRSSSAAPASTPVATASLSRRSFDDSGHHRSGDDDAGHRSRDDDAGHHSGRDDSGHHGGDDDSGHGRGRGRGGDDD